MKSVLEMKRSILSTVASSHGQMEERKVKEKDTDMTGMQVEAHLQELLELQGNRCALTGLELQFRGAHEDENFLPSPDRIDSDGHYTKGNIQVVCRFINFWKRDQDNQEFIRLLNMVRAHDES